MPPIVAGFTGLGCKRGRVPRERDVRHLFSSSCIGQLGLGPGLGPLEGGLPGKPPEKRPELVSLNYAVSIPAVALS